jgi:FixJ family two-component response regulator
MARTKERSEIRQAHKEVRSRFDSLSRIERYILRALSEGKSNMLISHQLGYCNVTAEAYQAQIMRKMGSDRIIDPSRNGLHVYR